MAGRLVDLARGDPAPSIVGGILTNEEGLNEEEAVLLIEVRIDPRRVDPATESGTALNEAPGSKLEDACLGGRLALRARDCVPEDTKAGESLLWAGGRSTLGGILGGILGGALTPTLGAQDILTCLVGVSNIFVLCTGTADKVDATVVTGAGVVAEPFRERSCAVTKFVKRSWKFCTFTGPTLLVKKVGAATALFLLTLAIRGSSCGVTLTRLLLEIDLSTLEERNGDTLTRLLLTDRDLCLGTATEVVLCLATATPFVITEDAKLLAGDTTFPTCKGAVDMLPVCTGAVDMLPACTGAVDMLVTCLTAARGVTGAAGLIKDPLKVNGLDGDRGVTDLV